MALAACTSAPTPPPATATLTPSPTSRFSTHEGPIIRATLPPTWTITPSPLPTSTPTATPVTPTMTPTAVPALADLCPSFTLTHALTDGHVYGWSETLTLVLGTELTAVTDPATGETVPLAVRFLATNPLDGKNLGAQLPGGQVAILELPIYQLPEPGLYRWQASVYGEGIGDQCVRSGWFIVVRRSSDLATLAAATLSAATAQAQIDATPAASATEMVE